MRILLIYTFLFLAAFSGFSQESTQPFSLEEAINYALENNRSVKNAIRDIDAAKQQKKETTTIGLPQIEGKIDYQNWLRQRVSLFPASFDPRDPASKILIPQIFGTTQSMDASATLTQLLFDGTYLVGLQSAKVFLEISKNAKEKTDLEVRKAVINAYGNVLLAEESVKIIERNVTVLEKNLEEITKIYENGLEEEESVEQLQITISSVKSNLKNTTRLKVLAYKMLNITLGLDLNTTTTLTDTLETLALNNIDITLLSTNDTIDTIIDYKIAENDKRSKELLLKLERFRKLPSLSAFINGAYTAYSYEFTFPDRDQKWYGSSLFGISMNIPLFSSGRSAARVSKAKIELEKSNEKLTEVEQQLKLLIASTKSDYQFAIEEYENKKQNLSLAERIETKNQTKFFEGLASSFDLRQAQTQLYRSQQELLQAMLDVIAKKTELETVLNKTN